MCAICDIRIEFGTEHPMGVAVAVAARRAIDAGVVEAAKHGWDRERAIPLMRGVQQRLELVHGNDGIAALPRFFVLLVETRTWACFQPGPSGFDPTAQAEPPDALGLGDGGHRDAMLVATETVLDPILRGKLDFETAERDGLLHLDAPASSGAPLRRACAAAWPSYGYSRFVCV